MIFFFKGIGFLLGYSPEFVPKSISSLLGYFIYYARPFKRRIILSNLHHCFPESRHGWRRRIALQNCCQNIETRILRLVIPVLTKERLSSILHIPTKSRATLKEIAVSNRPFILCSPDLGSWELITTFPESLDHPFPETGIVYRPFKDEALNQWIVKSREKSGITLLSRREGFTEGMKLLRAGNGLGILFDQNDGSQETLSLFFDRLITTSELPGFFAEKFDTLLTTIHTERIAFWHYSLRVEIHDIPSKSKTVTNQLNGWLEDLLRSNDSIRSSWSWRHNRWKTQQIPAKRFRIEAKRTLFSTTQKLPNKTRFWIRLPAQLDEIIRIIPSIRALQKARPDGEWTFISRSRYIPLFKALQLADHYLALPDKSLKSYSKFFKWRLEYPDTLIVFPSSLRHDIEAWLIGARQRFGIEKPHHPRPLLTDKWEIPSELDQSALHQSKVWELFFRHFGLIENSDFSPLALAKTELPSHLALPETTLIGIVSGTERNKTKGWPNAHWKKLLEDLRREQPSLHFVFFGDSFDRQNIQQITRSIPKGNYHNFAGQTTLIETAHLLKKCSFVIGNNTGNLHLSNALGVPVLGLYGASNPIRTGPVFSGSTQIIQPPNSQPTGGAHLSDLQPRQVKQTVLARLSRMARLKN
ncbi:MAG: hypothetical protein JKY51_11600 [Opitutaceae bacterium]|nr:hypothetical protein [Opitutaceae bacterium]